MQKKTNKKKILGIMSKLGNFINKSQPIVGDIPPEQEIEENTPKEQKQVKKEEKNFNLQIEDDEKAEYDLNDDDDEEEEEEEDDDNEEKGKESTKENTEGSTNDNDSSTEKKEEVKKEEIKELKKEEIKLKKKEEVQGNENKQDIKKEEKKEDAIKKEIKDDKKIEEKKETTNEDKKEIKEEKKIENKVEEKKEVKIEDKKEIKNENKTEDKKEDKKEVKKEVKKEDITEKKKEVKNEKEKSNKKIENTQKLKKDSKNANKPISKISQSKESESKVVPEKEKNEIKDKSNKPESAPKEKPKMKFQKKPKINNRNKICHFFLKKGTDIDIKEYDFFCIKKVKKGKTMLSKLNNLGINLNLNIKLGGINKVSNKLNSFFKKKPKDIKYTDYYLIISEHFIYFCKDAEIYIDEPDKRRIGSIIPFSNITKIDVEKEGEFYKIIFEIQFRNLNKTKEFFADNEIYGELLEIFHEFKKEYNLEYNIEIKEKKVNA